MSSFNDLNSVISITFYDSIAFPLPASRGAPLMKGIKEIRGGSIYMEAALDPAGALSGEPVAETMAPVPIVAPIVGVVGGRRYSTLVIFFPQHDGDGLATVIQDVRSIIEREGAIIISADTMGRKTLAYKIAKQTEGVYVNFVYSILPRAVAAIERDLNHKESVMRFLTSSES